MHIFGNYNRIDNKFVDTKNVITLDLQFFHKIVSTLYIYLGIILPLSNNQSTYK